MFLFESILNAVEMKFVIIFVLVCTDLYFCQADNTTGNQKICATQGTPININVLDNRGIKGVKGVKGDTGTKGDKGSSCKCSLQDSIKPSAHIEALNKLAVIYQTNQVIKDWSISHPQSHLAGGMKYHDGKLTVPIPGLYFIYVQLYYYYSGGPVMVLLNKKRIIVLQPQRAGKDEGTFYAAGVFSLKAGDVITVTPDGSNPRIYLSPNHSYFGAFLI